MSHSQQKQQTLLSSLLSSSLPPQISASFSSTHFSLIPFVFRFFYMWPPPILFLCLILHRPLCLLVPVILRLSPICSFLFYSCPYFYRFSYLWQLIHNFQHFCFDDEIFLLFILICFSYLNKDIFRTRMILYLNLGELTSKIFSYIYLRMMQ